MDNTKSEVLVAQPAPIKQNAWKIPVALETSSFAEVMSEELAHSLEAEEKSNPVITHGSFDLDSLCLSSDPDCNSDHLLAEMLQHEFDKEHDDNLKREEDHFNGKSKVSISFDNYRKAPKGYWKDDDSSSDETDDVRSWDAFEEGEKASPTVGKVGFTRNGSTITTKHDATICGRKNACRVMAFPPGFETGDGGGFDMKLSNNVYNHLKVHSRTEEKRHKRLHDKTEKSTAVLAFDAKTRLLLFKLVNNGCLEAINGTVSSGKEAVILHAAGGKSDDPPVPAECAIKVYKTTLNEFRNRDRYIQDDHRFKDRYSKQNPRKIIRLWAEKEMRNLQRMAKAEIRCPQVVLLRKHVLVMSFIGKDGTPAPKIKEATLSREQQALAYQQCVDGMKKLYTECKLVHADLSEYNILWYENKIWFIDVSQSVEPIHPKALEFLYRDCCNVSNFFQKLGVSKVQSPKELFTDVSGIDFPGDDVELINQIQDYEDNEELLAHGMSEKKYNFDYMFNLSKKLAGK